MQVLDRGAMRPADGWSGDGSPGRRQAWFLRDNSEHEAAAAAATPTGTDHSDTRTVCRPVLRLAGSAAWLVTIPADTTKAATSAEECFAMASVQLTVNGQMRQLEINLRQSLLDVLRENLDLTGTKKGCDQGQCGACTVLVDGRRVVSCLTLAVMKDGASITTIEGLAQDGTLHPLQQAFIDHDAFQCGYCTPGQICSAAGLIAEGKAKTVAEIRELMSGNICRCGAYSNIVAAIQQAMERS